MKKIQLVCLLAGLAAIVSLSPSRAQVPNQAYVSPSGSGAACNAGAPCLLANAILAIVPSGFVSCINGGWFNFPGEVVTLSKSFTVDCAGAVLTTYNGTGPVFTLNGSTSQVVILRNLTFDGGFASDAPFILVNGGATLIIENCRFQNIGVESAIAIQFTPSKPAAQLIIRDTVFANNGLAPGAGGGIQVAPTAGGSASVKLERVSFEYNVTSMVLSGPVNATMIGSTMQASRSNGILVGSGATLDIKDSTLMYNVGSAVSVAAGGTLRLSNNDIKGNQIGVSNSGGQALSFKNNRIYANGSTATLGTIAGGQ
jgi:hypothetical protein